MERTISGDFHTVVQHLGAGSKGGSPLPPFFPGVSVGTRHLFPLLSCVYIFLLPFGELP